jgi:hypothetical protein
MSDSGWSYAYSKLLSIDFPSIFFFFFLFVYVTNMMTILTSALIVIFFIWLFFLLVPNSKIYVDVKHDFRRTIKKNLELFNILDISHD